MRLRRHRHARVLWMALGVAVMGGAGLARADPDSIQVGAEGRASNRAGALTPRLVGPRGSRAPRRQGFRATAHTDRLVWVASGTYHYEALGAPVREQVRRIARDRVLVGALAAGDLAGAQAEARSQLTRPGNHHAHITRISVLRGAREVVNAVVNGNGSFVVAPARRPLGWHGRRVGTLLVSVQDVVGFIKLARKFTRAQIVVRGSAGRMRTSLPAAAQAPLPALGRITLAGRAYSVRSFVETGWRGERLTVWILERLRGP